MALDLVGKLAALRDQVIDDDVGDRLSHTVTVCALAVSALLVSTKQLVGSPISCWVPAHYTGNHQKYAENYCWIRNTYRLPFDEHVPKAGEVEKDSVVVYYQWMPIILMMQALFFYMPARVWQSFQRRAALELGEICLKAKLLMDSREADKHDGALKYICSSFKRVSEHRRKGAHEATISVKSTLSRVCCKCCGRSKGNYLITSFLFTKLLYIGNIVGQFFLLNQVLGFDFTMFGPHVISKLMTGKDWTGDINTPFPRITMCDLDVRRVGNIHRYSVQCVLPINLFTERLYLLLWFWIIIVAFFTLVELIRWVLRIMTASKTRYDYINKHLMLARFIEEDEDVQEMMQVEGNVSNFVYDYLRADGVFVLRLVAKNTTSAIVTQIVKRVFESYVAPQLEEIKKNKENKKNDKTSAKEKEALEG